MSVADTDTGADSPAEGSVHGPPSGKRKKSRAGRNLPAAIAVGAAIGFTIIAILIWDRYLWVLLVAIAMPVATHEVVRRLREAGYVIPFIPLLVGGQLMIWLTWHFHAVGALAGWRPDEFWAATPQELETLLAAFAGGGGTGQPPPDASVIAALKEQFPDG